MAHSPSLQFTLHLSLQIAVIGTLITLLNEKRKENEVKEYRKLNVVDDSDESNKE